MELCNIAISFQYLKREFRSFVHCVMSKSNARRPLVISMDTRYGEKLIDTEGSEV